MLPFLSGGGGTFGLNLEYTRKIGWALYGYRPVPDSFSEGIAIGVAWQVNTAEGSGPWKGIFENIEGNLGPGSGGTFRSVGSDPGTGYQGYTAGYSWPLELGLSRTQTFYKCLAGCPWAKR